MNWINWTRRAELAEDSGDWHEAKKCWYYAAQQASDGDTKAYYNNREDFAGNMIRLMTKVSEERTLWDILFSELEEKKS